MNKDKKSEGKIKKISRNLVCCSAWSIRQNKRVFWSAKASISGCFPLICDRNYYFILSVVLSHVTCASNIHRCEIIRAISKVHYLRRWVSSPYKTFLPTLRSRLPIRATQILNSSEQAKSYRFFWEPQAGFRLSKGLKNRKLTRRTEFGRRQRLRQKKRLNLYNNGFTRPINVFKIFFQLSPLRVTPVISPCSLRTLATDKNYNNHNRFYFHRALCLGSKCFTNILFSCWADGEDRKLLATIRKMF